MTMVSVLINGQEQDHISIQDRGLTYGDGLFETILVRSGRPVFLQQHLQRLSHGCQRLNIPRADSSALHQDIHRVIPPGHGGVIKIILTRGPGERGFTPPDSPRPTRIVQFQPPGHADASRSGISMRLCTTRLARQPILAGIKHLNQLERVLARAEWRDPGIQEGLMLDSDGLPIEGTMSNLFVVKQDQILTPDLSHCGVAGIIRQTILDHAADHALNTAIKRLSLDDVTHADEVFVSNSVMPVWPVVRFGNAAYPVGPLTRRVQSMLEQAINKDIDTYSA